MLRTRVKGGAASILPADAKMDASAAPRSLYELPFCPALCSGPMDRDAENTPNADAEPLSYGNYLHQPLQQRDAVSEDYSLQGEEYRQHSGMSNTADGEDDGTEQEGSRACDAASYEIPIYSAEALEPNPIRYPSHPVSCGSYASYTPSGSAEPQAAPMCSSNNSNILSSNSNGSDWLLCQIYLSALHSQQQQPFQSQPSYLGQAMGQAPKLPTSVLDVSMFSQLHQHQQQHTAAPRQGLTTNDNNNNLVGTFEGQEFQFLDLDNLKAFETSLIGG
jgi:hypothetical protein